MGKKTQIPLKFEERKLIEKYLSQGYSRAEIARKIGRSKNAVVSEVIRAGGIPYSAEKGQGIVDQNRIRKNINFHERNKGNKVTFRMKKRIESLEMQMEILHDAIKELLRR